ncbi:MAG: type II secretion system GspH family protein [Nitrospirales bacterium]|nr:type II secretion system protein [Nitrospira sp.]MDR4500538.1 type II secretion system GspH family protein [Nitrospirales bacterium]
MSGKLDDKGFALIAMMGVLAIVVILATALLPNMVTSFNTKANETENDILEHIGSSSATYLRSTHTWPPTLAAHTSYSPLDSTQLLRNDRLFPRYYVLHPNMSGFNNGTGLAETALVDARFLLISNRVADAAPTISNGTEFTTWWSMDESVNPELHIYRGNLASTFLRVSLSAVGNGGSFQIGGTTTHSSGGTLAPYERYHLPGTILSFDEANTFGTPELQVVLTSDVEFEFDPACEAGKQWHVPGVECGGEPAQFWLTTWGAPTGKSGVGTWNNDMMIAYGEPGLTFESGPAGTTAGTFRGPLVDLQEFGASVVESLHFVSRDITIGTGANTVDLKAGDILASDIHDVTMTSHNSLFVEEKDVYVFRPWKPGDYSSGTFFMLFDGSDVGWARVQGVSLVETATKVGGTTIQAGSFLMRTAIRSGIKLFVPFWAGNTTAGTLTDLYNADDYFYSFELVETPLKVGDVTLKAGQILSTTVGDGVLVGDNNLLVNSEDVFVLDLTGTGLLSAGRATMLFDGSDAGLIPSSSSDSVVGITLSGTCSNWLLPIINPGFETGDLTGWTRTEDVFGQGGVNQWNATTASYYMPSAPGGTYFASAETNGETGGNTHRTGLSQRIAVSACSVNIDAGGLVVTLSGVGHGQTDALKRDYGSLQLTFYDAVSGGNPIGSAAVSNNATAYSWTDLTIPYVEVPVGTRSIEVTVWGTKNAQSTYTDAGVDNLGGIMLAETAVLNRVSNGSFEEYFDFAGWTYAGTIGTVFDGTSSLVLEQASDLGITPPDGTYQARIRTFADSPDTETSGQDNGNLEAFFGFTNAAFNAKTGISIKEFEGIKQTVRVGDGSQLSFQWNFGTADTPGGTYNDLAFYYVTDSSGSEVQFTILGSVKGSSFIPGGPGGNMTGYQTTYFNFPGAGTYTIYFGVAEDIDTDGPSFLYLDDFQMTTS